MAKEPIISRRDLEEVAMLGMIGGAETAITHMNALGRRGSQGWDKVPIPEPLDKTILEEAGVVFGEVLNSLFIQVKYPDGWKVKGTDHYMYSNLLNTRGQARANIGLKVADSWGYLRASRLFDPSFHSDCWRDNTLPYVPAIKDSLGNILWRGRPMGRDLDVATNAAKELLTSIYPDWNNPRAYWELEKYDFPPNESEPPKGEKYSAYAEYFHVGSTSACDSGMSDTVIKLTDAEAVKFYKDLYGRETFYQLKVTVYKGDKVVEKFKAGPQPEDF